jgi:hypothetical protein
MASRLALLCIVVLVQAGTEAGAQDLRPSSLPSERLSISFPAVVSGPDRVPGATASGDFDGDQRPDLAMLINGIAVIFWAPSIYRAATLVDPAGSSHALDLAVLPGANDHPDQILTAGTSGLIQWTLLPSRQMAPTVLSSQPCSACTVVDLIGLGSPSFATLSLDGNLLRYHPSAEPGRIVEFSLGQAALDLCAIQWSSGGQQIALLLLHGVEIRDSGGRPVYSHLGESSVAMVAFRSGNSPSDQLAWIDQALPTGTVNTQWLNTLRLEQSPTGPSMAVVHTEPVGSLGLLGITAGNLDDDSSPELICSTAHGCDLIGFWGPAAGENYDAEFSFEVQSRSPIADCTGVSIAPLCHDLNNDAVPDLLSPLVPADELLYVVNPLVAGGNPLLPEPCAATEDGWLYVSYPPLEAGALPEVMIFVQDPNTLGMDDEDLTALPDAWWLLQHAASDWPGEIEVPLDSADTQLTYFIVSRVIDGRGAGPDSVFVYRPGSQTCPDASSRPTDPKDPGYGDPRKPEGLDPRTQILFGPGGEPPGGG